MIIQEIASKKRKVYKGEKQRKSAQDDLSLSSVLGSCRKVEETSFLSDPISFFVFIIGRRVDSKCIRHCNLYNEAFQK